MPSYSVAIRTLGLNPELLRKELESVFRQTVLPEKVVVYIAQGYKIPDFRVAYEQYVYTKKGMMTQRALRYDDITTEYILFLDDDVILADDSAEKLLKAIEDTGYDCMAPDMFENHKMPVTAKLYAAFSNLTFPHFGHRWAFKVHRNGSFSYISSPRRQVYESQSASGPCSLWRKRSFLALDIDQELWLDQLGFPFGEDQLQFYKLYLNGGKIGIHFDSGIKNMNAQTSSGAYHSDPLRFYKRARAQYLVWHRSLYGWRESTWSKLGAGIAFWTKFLCMIPVHCVAAVTSRNAKTPYYFIKGTIDGIKHSKTPQFRNLPPYIKK